MLVDGATSANLKMDPVNFKGVIMSNPTTQEFPFRDVMMDLETLDTKPGATILSIGAVYFNNEKLGEEFQICINKFDSSSLGFTTSPDTLRWWSEQSEEAKKILKECDESEYSVRESFSKFSEFLSVPNVRVWGNGSDFDNVILSAGYKLAGVKLPWGEYNNRCYRTLKNLARDIKIVRQGTHHDALSDAKSQAEHAIKILKRLNVVLN